ncbi:MAG: hypothetical protein KGH62_04120 [Candidatus Micrarchaeota archaeon]|nr:hypothetical protein [Candidatus Micrarchaeota archaeon]
MEDLVSELIIFKKRGVTPTGNTFSLKINILFLRQKASATDSCPCTAKTTAVTGSGYA